MEESLAIKYQNLIGDTHLEKAEIPNVRVLDFQLRVLIGKTEDIKVARCSHNIIRSKEEGEGFCRICHKDLRIVGEGRCNDYLVLRHPSCVAPICLNCAANNPDEFHRAFRRGLDIYLDLIKD